MMSADYFSQTKEHHQKAVNRLATGDEDDLIYACLELRKCIEAYCYNLLSSYLSEAPFRAVETWQPDKVLKELLAIDSGFENTSAFRMQVDDGSGKLGEWMSLGEDRRLPISYVRSSYQALGNFLHVPTIKQVNSGSSVQAEKIREKAAAISERLAAVLAPGRIVSNIGQFCTFNCSQCEAPIARRMPFLDAGGEVECGNCGQQYDYERTTDSRIKFVARAYSWECANCKTPRQVPQSQAKEGLDVSCPECSHPANLRFKAHWTVDTVREENN
jgi:DNA-directed RNA polymerase subunit RPC12/RpoP